jgi:hypothetical protein
MLISLTLNFSWVCGTQRTVQPLPRFLWAPAQIGGIDAPDFFFWRLVREKDNLALCDQWIFSKSVKNSP